MLASWKKSYDKTRQHIEKQRHHFTDKGLYNQSYGFSNSHVQMLELDHKEGWAPKNWSFWTVVLEKTFESPLDSKKIKLVNPKGNQSHWKDWCWSSNTLAHLMGRASSLEKNPDAEKDWRQKEKGVREDKMVGWHHWTSMDMSLSKLQQILKDGEAWHAAVHGVTKSQAQLNDWTTVCLC